VGTPVVANHTSIMRWAALRTGACVIHLLFPGLTMVMSACTVEERLPPEPDSGSKDASDKDALPDADADATCIMAGKRCLDGRPEQWSGTTWQPIGDCPTSTPYCYCGACLRCQPSTYRCTGNTLEQCSMAGEWTSRTVCGGATPVCNAQTGVCTGTRLVGGFTSVGPSAPAASGVRVTGGDFLLSPRICNSVKNACVQGGFVP
jgi:hypothetical protein